MDMSTAEYFKNIDSKEGLFLWMTMLISFFLGFLIAYLLRSAKVRKLKKLLREQEEQQKKLQTQLTSVQTQLAERNAELQEESRERVDLMDRLSQFEQQKQQHLTEVFQLNQQIEELHANNRTYLSSLEELDAQIQLLRTENEQLKAEPTHFADIPVTTVQVKETGAEVAQLDSRLDEFETMLERLSSENIQLKYDLELLKQEHSPRQITSTDTTTSEPVPQLQTDKAVLYDKIIVSDRRQDDLTKIDGVGDFLAAKLNAAGVFSYEDIAAWTPQRVTQITEEIGYLPGRIEKDNWVQQAAVLAQEGTVETEEIAAVPVATETSQEDNTDLKVIEGIGPKIEEILKAAGINNWGELAATEPGRLKEILEDAGDSYRMHNPYTWPLQARLAAAGRWDEFDQYKEELKGGRI